MSRAATLTDRRSAAHLLSSEIRPRVAKVGISSLRKSESAQFSAQLGACIEQVRSVCGLTLEEFSDALNRDARQIAKWIKAEERPQLETVLAVERFRGPLLIALAGLATDVDVRTTITVRRTA